MGLSATRVSPILATRGVGADARVRWLFGGSRPGIVRPGWVIIALG